MEQVSFVLHSVPYSHLYYSFLPLNPNDIKGISIGEKEHRSALFADDIILFLKHLNMSTKSLYQLLNTFGHFSGYKINKSKNVLFFLNNTERSKPPFETKLNITSEGFTYLGIRITSNVDNIITTNYDPLVKEIEEMLDRWNTLPVSMIGRINLIKMTVVPKLLYLFQSIPLFLPASFFSNLNKTFARFIWNNKQPRLRLSLLYLPYERGGLKMPNIKLYYWAAQLRSAMFYFISGEVPAWVEMKNYRIIIFTFIHLFCFVETPQNENR